MSCRLSVFVAATLAAVAFAQPRTSHLRPRRDPVVRPGVYRALTHSPTSAVRAWVFFTDKAMPTETAQRQALHARARSADPRAIERRALRRTRPGLVDYNDLSVGDRYVAGVRRTGARLRVTSAWLNAVSIEATLQQIEAIADLPFVAFIKPLGESVRIDPLPEPVFASPAPAAAADMYGIASEQLHQINIPAAHAAGYTGDGIVIGVLDTGFKLTHEAFNQPGHVVNVLGEWDFINDDPVTANEEGDLSIQHNHGTRVLGTIAAYMPDTLVGGAYDAAFYLAKTEDTSQEVPIEEDYYVAGLEWIEANGADIATSSLGYIDWYMQSDLDGETAVTTQAVNIATANGLVCLTAAGNRYHDDDPATSTLLAPADAFEVIACGAVDLNGDIAGFSSDGPSADGRVKPEILARGVSTATVSPDNDTGTNWVGGTSLSTPLIAAAAALVVQAHPEWTVSQVRAALFRSASDFRDNGTFDPEFVRGYGIIDVMGAIETPFGADFNTDGNIDLLDYAQLFSCLTTPDLPPGPGCEPADLDGDDDVDALDFQQFQAHFTGPL